jgi:thioredoxin reductase
LTDRGTVWRDEQWMTSVPGVFSAGDMQRGQSSSYGRSRRAEVPAPIALNSRIFRRRSFSPGKHLT